MPTQARLVLVVVRTTATLAWPLTLVATTTMTWMATRLHLRLRCHTKAVTVRLATVVALAAAGLLRLLLAAGTATGASMAAHTKVKPLVTTWKMQA